MNTVKNISRIVVIASALLVASDALGQQGYKAGLTYSTTFSKVDVLEIEGEGGTSNYSFPTSVGYTGGLVMNFGLNETWGLLSGLTMTQRMYNMRINENGNNVGDNSYLFSFDVPVVVYHRTLVKVLPHAKNKRKIYLKKMLGLEMRYLCQYTVDNYDGNPVAGYGYHYTFDAPFKSETALKAGLALDIDWWDGYSVISVGVSYHRSLRPYVATKSFAYTSSTNDSNATMKAKGDFVSFDVVFLLPN